MREISIHTFIPQAKQYLEQARPQNVPNFSPDKDFVVQPLGQGEYNMNFLVSQMGFSWVLRINTGSQIGLTKREQIAYEFKTLILLAPAGISPTAYFLDNSLRFLPYGVLGMAYLPGEKLDYRRDLEEAARLMARYHQLEVEESIIHLIHEKQPLTLTYERCVRMMQVYLDSDIGHLDLKTYLQEVKGWANQARHQETYYINDPWNCIINTEVNNTNWIIDREAGTLHLVDWEKPLWGDPSQDLSHFRVPTTTLWKTDYRMTNEDHDAMMTAYKNDLQDPHLQDTIEERTRLRDPFNCLRGVSWCAMAWVQYQRGDHLLKNVDTFRKLSLYVDFDFVRSLFDPFMKSY